jgi:hypothetical protein
VSIWRIETSLFVVVEELGVVVLPEGLLVDPPGRFARICCSKLPCSAVAAAPQLPSDIVIAAQRQITQSALKPYLRAVPNGRHYDTPD